MTEELQQSQDYNDDNLPQPEQYRDKEPQFLQGIVSRSQSRSGRGIEFLGKMIYLNQDDVNILSKRDKDLAAKLIQPVV